ncbi:hypothetical protein SASPL_148448 [Salvia splendens]|uniref:SET domain-containing protein n=1 Tax=Salvia splendens TaxID=180675 RepID=A0A8X8Z4C8_SALSN|nr:hypothetical protein SASPL_148448 [Salvia splendens]
MTRTPEYKFLDPPVLGRRRIYYDHRGSESLICSDNEDDLLEGEKPKFSDGEDCLIRVAFLECGIGNEVVDELTQFERCTMLMETDQQMEIRKKTLKEEISGDNVYLDQSLSTALDSFDNLFCRCCLFGLHTVLKLNFRICNLQCLTVVYIVVPKFQPVIMKSKLANLLQKWTVSPVEINVIFSNHANLQEIQSKLHINGAIGTLWRKTYTSRDYKYLEEIARNLLPDLKTCEEVSNYMSGDGAIMLFGSSAKLNEAGRDGMDPMEPDMAAKSRISHKRGRVRKGKVKSSRKYRQSLWRMIAEGKDIPYKQYSPCMFQPTYGKQCPCFQNGTYCAQKAAKITSEGAIVLKVNVKANNSPALQLNVNVIKMFSGVVGCGDGSLGGAPRRGDSQCADMMLLLRQHQRTLLAKLDIVGWGAFVKNPVNKDDYLGEYTGELISHQEADRRGEINDVTYISYLFNLNDKVMLVAGDHRVGIYANEQIQAGEEIFYDYRYGPDESLAWALKPTLSKRDVLPLPRGRAKKHKSG